LSKEVHCQAEQVKKLEAELERQHEKLREVKRARTDLYNKFLADNKDSQTANEQRLQVSFMFDISWRVGHECSFVVDLGMEIGGYRSSCLYTCGHDPDIFFRLRFRESRSEQTRILKKFAKRLMRLLMKKFGMWFCFTF
jgi:hypothetical protein